MRRLALAAALLAAAACGPSSPAGARLDGAWEGVLIPNPRGHQSLSVTVTQSGVRLSGQGVSVVPGPDDGPFSTPAMITGQVDGDRVSFVVTTAEPGWSGTFDGRQVSGDRLEGTFTTAGAQSFPSLLTRTR